MSPIIKLSESCNKISVKTAMLTWTGTAVLIIHDAKSIQTITAIDSIDGKTQKTIPTFPGISGFLKIVCSSDLPISAFIGRLMQQYLYTCY